MVKCVIIEEGNVSGLILLFKISCFDKTIIVFRFKKYVIRDKGFHKHNQFIINQRV